MKKPLLLIILIIAVALPAFSQRVLKDIAQGTDNASIFSGGAFSSGDTLFFRANSERNYQYSYYLTKGTGISTKKLITPHYYGNIINNENPVYHKFKNSFYIYLGNSLSIIKNDSISLLKSVGGYNYMFLDFFELNNQLYFMLLNTTENKVDFWKTNGTEEGTILYKSIITPPLPGTSGAYSHFYLNNKYYHTFEDSSMIHLLITDGTTNGTTMIEHHKIGAIDYESLGNKFYFSVEESGNDFFRTQLWQSEGDSTTNQKVITQIDGDTNYSVRNLFKFKNDLYFLIYSYFNLKLSKLDIATNSAVHVTPNIYYMDCFLIKEQKIYYSDLTHDNTTIKFYENSGSLESNKLVFSLPYQTSALYKLYKGNTNYYVSEQKRAAGNLSGDVTYWVFDGSNLKKITDLNATLTLGLTYNAIGVVGDIFYFSASDSQHGYELWRTDGTSAGTFMVKDINQQIASSDPEMMFALGNYMYFMANDISRGKEVWRTNGTTTSLYADLNKSDYSNNHVLQSEFNSKMNYKSSYIANISYHFYEFTQTGNIKLLDSLSIYPFSVPEVFHDSLYFMGYDGNLWKSDGTAIGTRKAIHLDSTNNGIGNWGIYSLRKVDKLLFFTSNGNNGASLWVTNGYKNGTIKLQEFTGGVFPYEDRYYKWNTWTIEKWLLFIFFNNVTNKTELWRSDGTSAGTIRLGEFSSFAGMFGVFNKKFYFTNDSKLWQSDGTLVGTFQIDGRSFISGEQLRGRFYLSLNSGNDIEYYELDKNNNLTLLNKVSGFNGSSGDIVGPFNKIDDRYLLNYISNSTTQNFYLTDGNKENFRKVFTLKNSRAIFSNYDFFYFNKKVYFTAIDSLKGQELWVWDFECPDGYTIRDSITKDSTIIYGKNIWGQNIVSNNKTVTYDAKNGITLQPGFEVQKGTVFKTKLIGCANTTTNVIEDNIQSKNEPLTKVNITATYPQLIDFLYYYPNKSIKEIYEQAMRTKLAPVTWDIVTEKDI